MPLRKSSDAGLRTPQQEAVAADLARVRAVVGAYVLRSAQARTADFLNAAASGSAPVVRAALQQGLPPDSCDYDGRTALMLASVKVGFGLGFWARVLG